MKPVDVTPTNSPDQVQQLTAKVPRCLQKVKVEAESIKVKVGRLEMDLNAACFGHILLDGHPVSCRGFKIRGTAGELIRIDLIILP